MASLEERIAVRLREVLAHQERGGFTAPPDTRQGMAIGGPDRPEIVLTVEDVARLVVAEIKHGGMVEKQPATSPEQWKAMAAKRGFVSTPEGRAWAKRVLAESKERSAQFDYVGFQRALHEWVHNGGPRPKEFGG